MDGVIGSFHDQNDVSAPPIELGLGRTVIVQRIVGILGKKDINAAHPVMGQLSTQATIDDVNLTAIGGHDSLKNLKVTVTDPPAVSFGDGVAKGGDEFRRKGSSRTEVQKNQQENDRCKTGETYILHK
jgi:hypothetical protein